MSSEIAVDAPSEAAKNQFALFGTRRFWPLFAVQFFWRLQ